MYFRINTLLFFTFFLFIMGCGATEEQPKSEDKQEQPAQQEQANRPPAEQPHIEGVLSKLEKNKILVIQNPDELEVSEQAEVQLNPETKYWIQQGNQYKEGKQADLTQDMKVKVWYTGIVVDSHPVQAKGGHVVYEK